MTSLLRWGLLKTIFIRWFERKMNYKSKHDLSGISDRVAYTALCLTFWYSAFFLLPPQPSTPTWLWLGLILLPCWVLGCLSSLAFSGPHWLSLSFGTAPRLVCTAAPACEPVGRQCCWIPWHGWQWVQGPQREWCESKNLKCNCEL